MSKFEIELRGSLTPGQCTKLEQFLEKNGKLIKEYKRAQWCFGLSHDKKIDLRIKDTNGDHEFSLKVGKLGNKNRKEISVPFPEENMGQALEMLKFLGHREGVTFIRNARIFEYKGIEWALVEVPGHSYYFEAEKLVNSKSEGTAAEKEIRQVSEELNLKVFTSKQTVDYIKILDLEANKVFKL